MKLELEDAAPGWWWICWSVSGEDALRAKEIYENMSLHEVAILAGIKAYGESWKPKLKK